MQTCGVFSEARSAIESSQVKMWLYQGDWQAVGRWVEALEKRLGAEDTFCFEDELARITWARVWIAQNQPEEAIRLLSSLEPSARAGSRHGRLIEILMLKALALQMSGEAGQADITLTESLMLAEPDGYLRIFLDEGRSMQQLLAEWQRRAKPSPSRDCARRILSEFEVEPQVVTMAQAKPSPTRSRVDPEVRPTEDALVEPLSPREQEVLQLIAQGKTNKEIARKLVVAPGTVKAHTASIYRKLDVTNRTEAAARARQFGLLP
jgi:LuxR family maltose regulon positive regulatory protein